MGVKTIDSVSYADKKVLVRVDFNVPIVDGVVTDNRRIVSAIPTLKKILKDGGIPIVISHLGRPKGQVVSDLSLKIVVPFLKEQLPETEVLFCDEVVTERAEKSVASLQKGQLLLLENLRFHKEETDNGSDFAKKLASFVDAYVSDAFGTSHRAHASTEGVTHYVSSAVAGYLVQKELEAFDKVVGHPDRPLVTILGGSKVSDKIQLLHNLIDKSDKILIGGSMSHTFLASQGYELKDTKIEADKLDIAQDILSYAQEKDVEIVLPIDFVLADEFSPSAKSLISEGYDVPDGMMALDIGPKTQQLFCEKLNDAKTIIWNGPVGVFEMQKFEKGTRCLATALANHNGNTLIGGGDTASAVKQFDVSDRMYHISTGGGASLELLEGKTLPGIACLNQA